jgi:SAM-dependent methyltransferase
MTDVARFYDDLAHYYHLLFESWEESIARQSAIWGRLLEREIGPGPHKILDAACGIGTQSLGFARAGHEVTGSDLSPAAIRRDKHEDTERDLKVSLRVADLRVLSGYHAGPFDAVVALDNALTHFESREDLTAAVREMASLLRPGGLFVASVRDYDTLAEEKPRVSDQRVFGGGTDRRVAFQVWDWRRDGRGYRIHQYILQHETDDQVTTRVFTTTYWAWRRRELVEIVEGVGLAEARWLEPAESGFYQPIIVARRDD